VLHLHESRRSWRAARTRSPLPTLDCSERARIEGAASDSQPTSPPAALNGSMADAAIDASRPFAVTVFGPTGAVLTIALRGAAAVRDRCQCGICCTAWASIERSVRAAGKTGRLLVDRLVTHTAHKVLAVARTPAALQDLVSKHESKGGAHQLDQLDIIMPPARASPAQA